MSEKTSRGKTASPQAPPPAVSATPGSGLSWLVQMLQLEGAYLLPLRLFIGIGWLRAGLEKCFDPSWHTGAALSAFFGEQLESGLVVFPFYQTLIQSVFEPHIALLCWSIMLGEVLIGLALLSGTFSNLALLGGMLMATNFILAGQVNPGAFYIVIQLILFIANVGAILGVDYWLSRTIPYTVLVAQPKFQQTYRSGEKWSFLALAGVSAFIACAVVPYIRDYSFGSVSDPAMILFVLAMIAVCSFLIAYFRLQRVYLRRTGDLPETSFPGKTYHVVFCPKYRYRVLEGALGQYLEQLLHSLVDQKAGVALRELTVQADYVYMVLELAPGYELSKVVVYLKRKSSLRLYQTYPHLAKGYWDRQLWSGGYRMSKTSLNEAKIRDYIKWREDQEKAAETSASNFPLAAVHSLGGKL